MKLTHVLFAGLLVMPGSLWAQEIAAPDAKSFSPALAPGDQLAIRMFDFPEFGVNPLTVTVSADGMIRLPYAGSIDVAGLSPSSVEREISKALQTKGIVKDPNVSVSVVSAVNLVVQVMGQVLNPRALPLFAPAPLSYILGQSGGITGLAAHHVTIIHHSDQAPTSIDFDPQAPASAAMNTLVYPGDIVNVSHVGLFFAVGEVSKPGIYPLTGGLAVGQGTVGIGFVEQMTLLKALTQVGGITSIAARSKSRILRTVDGKREEIIVDLVKLEKGQVADPILHADDIIYVPSSYIRSQTNNLFSTVLSTLYTIPVIKTF